MTNVRYLNPKEDSQKPSLKPGAHSKREEGGRTGPANRVPVVLQNKYQAVKARYKLARLKNDDPLVLQCKQAVQRITARSG